MQLLEVSGAVRHTYVIRRLKVNHQMVIHTLTTIADDVTLYM
jgi:hypothetical protein